MQRLKNITLLINIIILYLIYKGIDIYYMNIYSIDALKKLQNIYSSMILYFNKLSKDNAQFIFFIDIFLYFFFLIII